MDNLNLEFVIPGKPVPKARPRVSRGRAYTPKRTKDYEAHVKHHALLARSHARQKRATGSVKAVLTFRGANGNADLDNLAKSILDACNDVLWEDDRLVVDLRCIRDKGKGDPGVTVKVRQL